ncbi:hypothetical protein H4Q26_006491 [Puccinia striiformis f. sp. tritici PST-130]|nr:hypothetical protein H4Q26_006491 [Puccinia striiformis f. sp. tritici PST-130]
MRRCYPLAHLLALCALLHRLILGGDFITEAGPTLALDLLPSSSGSGAPLVEVADQLGEGGVIPGDRLKTLDRLKETRKLRRHTSYNNSPHDVHTRSDPDDFWDMREPIPPGFIPMPSITRWSVVHPDLFIRYHSPFKARIDSFSNKYTLRMSVRRNEKMKNLPVTWYAASILVQKHPGEDRLHGGEELSRHDALMSWLNELVFSNENRLPICGEITEIDFERLKDQGYNSAQKRLITYLQGQPEDAIFYTDLMTLALIGIWYKRELPHEWAERFLSSEKVFWLRMQEAIGEARQDRDWRAGQWIEKMYKGQPGDTTLGNFDLIELRRALQSKSNRRRPWSERRPWVVHKDNFKPSVVEREIIMAHQKVNKLVNTPPSVER